MPFSSKSRTPAVCPDVRQSCETISSENNGAHNLKHKLWCCEMKTATDHMISVTLQKLYTSSQLRLLLLKVTLLVYMTVKSAPPEEATAIRDQKFTTSARWLCHCCFCWKCENESLLLVMMLFDRGWWHNVSTAWTRPSLFHGGLLWSTASQTESFWRICPLNQDTAYESTTISVVTTHLDSTTKW